MDHVDLKIPSLLIPLLPFLGWLILRIRGNRLGRTTAGVFATALVAGSYVLGLLIRFKLWGTHGLVRFVYWEWIVGNEIEIPFGLQLDSLSILMVLTVSGVSALIHAYSIGYMTRERDYSRYFAHLNLLTSFMLLLVLADNFVLMFVGWVGVGISSYLLVGFDYEKKDAIQAAKKTFIMGSIADAGLLFGLLLLAASPLALEPGGLGRSLTYEFVFTNIRGMIETDPETISSLAPLITAIALLMLFGAIVKSAQLPLSTWLPDSTQGPAPTDALIQSGTVVVAGVYLIARAHLIFLLSPLTLTILSLIGALTILYGAAVALVQTDMRKVLAYSTISQVGFMFLGCGAGAFIAGIFHLVTHAFAKACLVLGAGSVIIGTNGERDLRRLGGLRQWMPFTRWTFLIATAALAGFPLLSGFFSLSTIQHEAILLPFPGGWGRFAGILGFAGVLLTAVYIYRLYYRIFEGDFRGPSEMEPRKSGSLMRSVMWILAGLSVVIGFAGLPFPGLNGIRNFLDPVFQSSADLVLGMRGMQVVSYPHWIFMALILLMFGGGLWVARTNYVTRSEGTGEMKIRYRDVYRILWDGLKLDDFYRAIFAKPGTWLCGLLWHSMDADAVDKQPVAPADGTRTSLWPYGIYVLFGLILIVWLTRL